MKLFVPPPRADRAPKSLAGGSPDSLGRGMDVALTIGAFLALGVLLDRSIGTTPVFTIVLAILAAVGQFVRMKYVYDAEMERLEAERLAKRTGGAKASRDHVEDVA